MVEVIVASIIVAFAAVGVWGVYWSVVNTYYVEQKGVNIHMEGERILDLIINGGYFSGNTIYGLNAMSAVSGYPLVGSGTSGYFTDSDDYRIEFILDNSSGNTRYAEFSVKFSGVNDPTSILYFQTRADGILSGVGEYNYDVEITKNLLQRKSGTDPDEYGNYDKTWFKAQLLPKDSSSDYCSGVKVSFYLVDMTQPLQYNYRLDRELTTPISDPEQRRSFLGGIPYPKYFSTTIYFPNRE